jgi:hypothetical protein
VKHSDNFTFFSHWLYSPCGPWPLFSFLISSKSIGLLGRVMSSSQGPCLNTGQHKHRINTYTHTPDIHALSGILTHDHSVRASEDDSCLKPLGCRDRHFTFYYLINYLRADRNNSGLILGRMRNCFIPHRMQNRSVVPLWRRLDLSSELITSTQCRYFYGLFHGKKEELSP